MGTEALYAHTCDWCGKTAKTTLRCAPPPWHTPVACYVDYCKMFGTEESPLICSTECSDGMAAWFKGVLVGLKVAFLRAKPKEEDWGPSPPRCATDPATPSS